MPSSSSDRRSCGATRRGVGLLALLCALSPCLLPLASAARLAISHSGAGPAGRSGGPMRLMGRETVGPVDLQYDHFTLYPLCGTSAQLSNVAAEFQLASHTILSGSECDGVSISLNVQATADVGAIDYLHTGVYSGTWVLDTCSFNTSDRAPCPFVSGCEKLGSEGCYSSSPIVVPQSVAGYVDFSKYAPGDSLWLVFFNQQSTQGVSYSGWVEADAPGSDSGSSGLSTGAIAGIAVGAAVLVIVLVVLIALCCRARRQPAAAPAKSVPSPNLPSSVDMTSYRPSTTLDTPPPSYYPAPMQGYPQPIKPAQAPVHMYAAPDQYHRPADAMPADPYAVPGGSMPYRTSRDL